MMKSFLSADFLLSNAISCELYHDHAAKMPIIDYHNHLPPEDIANDRRFANITEAALEGDHYKWRAMRTNGVSEELITGNAPAQKKWQAWAATLPYTLRNPLYHWQHLELQRYFHIGELLDASNADAIYERCGEFLEKDDYSSRGLLRQQSVKILCTTDDPLSDLKSHKICQEKIDDIKVLPTYRPDRAIFVGDLLAWNDWFDRLGELSDLEIKTLDDALRALKGRHDFFHTYGCRLSDHGLKRPYYFDYTDSQVQRAFSQARSGKEITADEGEALNTAFLQAFGRWNAEKDWAMQFHLGPLRNNNTRLGTRVGSDGGFDSIGDEPLAHKLSRLLDSLDKKDELPRTILYNLNPRDNAVLATMSGNFQDESIPGKIQFGSGWWFQDQLQGMEAQINDLSNLGLISRFVGMLTDSRSFLSFPRHEYFRRLLCDIFGRDIVNGKCPKDIPFISQMIRNICYHNAEHYFNF